MSPLANWSTNALNINVFLLPRKFLQPVSLAILTIWFLFNPLTVPVPARHLLSPFLTHQPSHWKSQIAHSDMHHPVSGINSQIYSVSLIVISRLTSSFTVSSSLSSSPLSSSITPSLFYSKHTFSTNLSDLNTSIPGCLRDHGTCPNL